MIQLTGETLSKWYRSWSLTSQLVEGRLTDLQTSGTNSGTIVITDGANNNITLTPNGTGDVVLADTVTVSDSGAETLSSSGLVH